MSSPSHWTLTTCLRATTMKVAVAMSSVFGGMFVSGERPAAAQDFSRLTVTKAAKSPVRDRGHVSQRYIESWHDLQSKNVVMQRRDYSCGAAALATILRYGWGEDVDEADTLRALNQLLTPVEIEDRIQNGFTMFDLRRLAYALGYETAVGRLTIDDLAGSKIPLMVALRLKDFDHFVVVRGIADGRVYLADPIRGNLRVPVSEFQEQWIDQAVLVVAAPGRDPPSDSPLKVRLAEREFPALNRQLIRVQPDRSHLRP